MRKGGGGLSREVKMEAPSPARWKVLIKRREPQTDARALFYIFRFVTTNPHRVLSVSSSGVKTYLPIMVSGGIESKFAIGVIFRFCFDLSDLPPACFCPSNTKGGGGGWGGNSIF